MFQVKQLIIIGGPSGAGKSFLIEKIRRGDCPRLCEQLGIANPSSWLYLTANQLKYIRQPIIEQLVVHYSLYDQYSQKNGFHHLHKLISTSDRVTILTLYVQGEILIERIKSRILTVSRERKYYIIQIIIRIVRLWKKQKLYKCDFSEFIYKRWFNEFIQSKKIMNHWLLDSTKSDILIAYPYKTYRSGSLTDVKKMMGS